MRVLSAISLILIAAVTALGQDPDAMQKLMEAGLPNSNHKLLEAFVGKWKVDVWYKLGTTEGKSSADCTFTMSHGGRYLNAEYKSEMMGQPFMVNQIIGYDNLKKKFFEFQIESDNTGYQLALGARNEKSGQYDLYADSADPMTMKPAKLHIVKRVIDKNKFIVEWYTVRDGGKEEKTVVLTHTRAM